jgi:hypothetical protein
MTGWMPGGSAGTSFCSGTEISISFRAMALPPVFSFYLPRGHCDGQAPFTVKL